MDISEFNSSEEILTVYNLQNNTHVLFMNNLFCFNAITNNVKLYSCQMRGLIKGVVPLFQIAGKYHLCWGNFI